MFSLDIVEKKLAVKLGAYTIVIAIVMSAIVSAMEMRGQYRQSVSDVLVNAEQMIELTLDAAAESVYQLDTQIAGDLLKGLMQNNLFLEVAVIDELGGELARISKGRTEIAGIFSIFDLPLRKLHYDLPIPVGSGASGSFEATLDVRAGLIPFYDLVVVKIFARLLEAIGLSFLVILAVMYLITSPLSRLATMFSEIDPGSEHRLTVPPNHNSDELGELAHSANRYLEVASVYQLELAHSEEVYRGILDNMAETYYRTDKDGLIVMSSKSVETLLGYSSDEMLGRPLAELYVSPRDRDVLLDLLRHDDTVQDYESLLLHKDGSHVLVSTNIRLLRDAEGKVSGLEGMVRDVTESKVAEQLNTRLGRIIENSTNEVYVFADEDLSFMLVNRGARRNLGYSMEELLELTPVDIKPEFTFDAFNSLIQPLRDATLEALNFESLHRRKDGSTYPVEIRLQYARSENPPLFFAMVQDITERKAVEGQLSHAYKMEAVGQLTGGISHDFNNLLTVIIGNIELAKSQPELTQESTGFLADSLVAAEKGATLTQRLLAFSRKQALRPEVIDTRTLISGMDDLLRRTLREDIEIKIVGGDSLWSCEVDPAQLENVILNLAINARDAMPGGGRLTIETSNVHVDEKFATYDAEINPGQYVLLAVSDTGSGMLPEVRSQVFDPFFTTKDEGKGSGLGLSMVYGFVKQSGGSIDIDSEVGEGTTIKIYLPRSLGEIVNALERDSIPVDVDGAGQVILVVEDNVDLGKVVVEMLRSLGYAPLFASNVQQAIDLLESSGVDLLLTDVILTGSEKGTDLVKEVEKRWPETLVIYMSGYSQNAIIHDGRLDPGVELLPKPFSKKQLADKIAKIINPK